MVTTPSFRLGLLLAAATIAGTASTASAHKISVFATVQDNEIHGEVYAQGGAVIAGATVTALDQAGKQLGTATTDAEGQFHFTPRVRCDWHLVVDAGDGHGAEYTVSIDELPEDLPTGLPADESLAVSPSVDTPAEIRAQIRGVKRQLTALRKDIALLKDELRYRDIIGGVGYIMGIAGLAFYFLGMRRKQSK